MFWHRTICILPWNDPVSLLNENMVVRQSRYHGSPITARLCKLQSRKPALRPVSAALDSAHAGSFSSSFGADMQMAILGSIFSRSTENTGIDGGSAGKPGEGPPASWPPPADMES